MITAKWRSKEERKAQKELSHCVQSNDPPTARKYPAGLCPRDTGGAGITQTIREASNSAAWKRSLKFGALACLAIFIINLCMTIWSSTLPLDSHNGQASGRRVIFEGSCSTTRTLNILIHLITNISSSVLLAASNYGMQCLTAPTRAEVNAAHAKLEWLDIGILSIRNLRKAPWSRVFLWWLLVLSSLPLHFLYNSIVYSSLTTYKYEAYDIDHTELTNGTYDQSVSDILQLARVDQLDNLTTSQCINEYAITFQTSRSDVIVVTSPSPKSATEATRSLTSVDSHIFRRKTCPKDLPFGFEWICPLASCEETCRSLLPGIKSQPDDWKPLGDNPVRYCLSRKEEERCRLNFDLYIAAIVLTVNIIKAAVLVRIVRHAPTEPLLVLGDAIQSFLKSPDAVSRGHCLASKDTLRRRCGWWEAITIKKTRRFWGAAVTKSRWTFIFALYFTLLGMTICFVYIIIEELTGRRDFKSLWNLGFGTVTEVALLSTGMENLAGQLLPVAVIIANTGHFLFSLLYFQYNGLLTSMAEAKEWSDFGHKRKPLRVSEKPRGEQKSRYFLQLPYRLSLPLLSTSILMHWMLSQSIFVVAVEGYRFDEDDPDKLTWVYLTCGYSPLAFMFVLITSGVMITALVATAFRRLPTNIPVAGSCSLAIAAACHQHDSIPQPEASLLPLKWGVMSRGGERQGLTHHCGFSFYPVEEPQENVYYS
ncbi:uncharacterized protein B0J16DRAFT_353441 [Fusarium flagelliforme]|uniref:uncharacterized protein n=1 Tax=Fusarium flagelliforme TaxID=2675880 RepID=UPI001E8DB774|nr:uncharacterized protein B0J16DRAFT_353441 [Fusarium flagelliforme]KAH7191753.1 hypothetical protein B0J16DRAFT_353441 [Fusarium flagelliforme]